MDKLTILSASEAFLFPPDRIRLSHLIMQDIRTRIQQAFSFQVQGVGQPPATFSPIEQTNPPGLVFEWGAWSKNGVPFPIRALHIDSRQVVWQVAGAATNSIEPLMEHLLSVCSHFHTAEGNEILGHWRDIQWYSELTFTLDSDLETWKRAFPLLALIDEALKPVVSKEKKTIPSLSVFNYLPSEKFPGDFRPWHGSKFNLTLRAGTSIEEKTFYSAAPLQTEAHIALIERIEDLLQRH